MSILFQTLGKYHGRLEHIDEMLWWKSKNSLRTPYVVFLIRSIDVSDTTLAATHDSSSFKFIGVIPVLSVSRSKRKVGEIHSDGYTRDLPRSCSIFLQYHQSVCAETNHHDAKSA